MANPTIPSTQNPVDLARKALKRITELGLPPTPENYTEQYRQMAGEPLASPAPSVPADPNQVLVDSVQSVLQIAATTTNGLFDDIGRFSVDFKDLVGEGDSVQDQGGMADLLKKVTASALWLQQAVAQSQAELDDSRKMMERMREELQESRTLVQIDPLTGVYNRRGMEMALARELARARRHASRLSVAMIDIDHFKKVNDQWGHDAGDKAIAHIAALAKGSLRESDVVARYGGEEFLLLLPDSDLQGGHFVVDRLRALIEKSPLRYNKDLLQIRISGGVSAFAPGDSMESLVQRADRALYEAKNSGRNRVIAAEPPEKALAA